MKLAVITVGNSDFLDLLSKYADVTTFSPNEKNIDGFDAYAILGGNLPMPLTLPIDTRLTIEKVRKENKPVFAEWCSSIGYVDGVDTVKTVSGRMVYVADDGIMSKGTLMDDHDNEYLKMSGFESCAEPILCFGGHMIKHDTLDEVGEYEQSKWTLFKSDSNTMMCSLRLCNYVKARMSPSERWDAVAGIIISHLIGKKVDVKTTPVLSTNNSEKSAEETFNEGIAWFENANMYLDEGESGVLEGLKHNILPTGEQLVANLIRNDCAAEVGSACFFDWYLNKNELSYKRFKNLQKFSFEKMFEAEGEHRGLLRWHTIAWDTCYQDDVAKVMLGTILNMQMTGDMQYLDELCAALDYMLKSTGTDGLRTGCTRAYNLTSEKIHELASKPADFPCAHYNGFYMAVLAMVYSFTKNQTYLDAAIRGMDTLMEAYPETVREHSETQELCRLILPLATLYEVTKDEKYKDYLYDVCARLEAFKHPSGGYVEYDTGYKALRSRTEDSESSLLADNGDPIMDLLYSVNWLPLGFAYAYKVTGDEMFKKRWQSLVAFLSRVQMKSNNPIYNGCWCRGIDLDRMEAYGMPHDVGWGACVIETGWTVGEILMGIGYGITLGMPE